jgi:capsular polysaccharide transport system permease protein
MTHQAQLRLEERFGQLKASISADNWTSDLFLLKKVEELEKSDIALAFRLMQRVKNLNPSDNNQVKLAKLRGLALKARPELTTLSSAESQGRGKLLESANGIKEHVSKLVADPKIKKFKHPFILFVLVPFFLFSFYQVLLASSQYESQARLIVKEPNGMATLDPAMAIMSGFGVGSSNLDTELVKAYIQSNDMLAYLNKTSDLGSHYTDTQYDIFSRLDNNASREELLSFYLDRVSIEIDEKSQVLSVFVKAFSPEFAHLMSTSIVSRAEWYINEVGHKLAKKQSEFVTLEHQLVEKRLQQAKSNLLAFQRRYNLLDPQAEGMALQQITYSLEGQIAVKQTELSGFRDSMSEDAPQVIQARSQLDGMIAQLEKERSRLTSEVKIDESLPAHEQNLSVSEILAKFSDYKINLELALQAYTSSQISLEKSRIEAYRQLKYLVTVETPTHPHEAKYPEVLYNISLFLAVILMLYGIGRIIVATVTELR